MKRLTTRLRSLTIIYRPIAYLKSNTKNERRHSRRQVKQIARSMKAFGFNVPILIDRDGNIIAGHGRFEAAKENGESEVPTILLDHLTDAEARAFAIADNRLTEISTWDEVLLAQTLKELSALDLNFEIEATGFSIGEIDVRIEGLGSAQEAGDDPADKFAEATVGPSVTRLGNVWDLGGRHRIVCGSALDPAAFKLLLQGQAADMVFIDPPYNVRIEGHASGLGKIRHRDFVMASGEMTEAQFADFLRRCYGLIVRYSADGSLHFVCMDWRHLRELLAAIDAAASSLLNLCVWVKTNAGLGSLYRSQHELVAVLKHGSARHRNNVELGKHGRHRSNVWRYPNISSFGRSGEEGNLLRLHPTVKPIRLVADAILDCTARGDSILDSFLGSGTTIIAAERTGRRCYGLELDPHYVDVAVRRWQAYTGDIARDATTGKTFDDLASDKEHHHASH
jgi:DNA modification methylase